MREFLRIDSPFMGAGMPKAYSREPLHAALAQRIAGSSSGRRARSHCAQLDTPLGAGP